LGGSYIHRDLVRMSVHGGPKLVSPSTPLQTFLSQLRTPMQVYADIVLKTFIVSTVVRCFDKGLSAGYAEAYLDGHFIKIVKDSKPRWEHHPWHPWEVMISYTLDSALPTNRRPSTLHEVSNIVRFEYRNVTLS
jgi:hypothetical protein